MITPVFDSWLSTCKTPFGAVSAGTEVRFTLFLPKIQLTGAPQLRLYEMDRWDDPRFLRMDYDSSNPRSNAFSCVFTPTEPKLYSYHFEVPTPTETLQVKRMWDGESRFDRNGQLWQLTVYDPALSTPEFFRHGTAYQIFPDRFCRSGLPKENVPDDRVLRADWEGIPWWRPNERGEVTNSDYFGGDLRGIESKLEYLCSLGVTVVYLNPIFEAHSNHRYNTADYRKIDPLLGTEEDFRRLCEKAREKGISIILDGVFSHTGSDSRYFNLNRRYGDSGAANDQKSPYYSWYGFRRWPDDYDSWWGFKTLPNVNECDASYLEFICGKDGVLQYWLDLGAKGFRLDVADELPDLFLDELRRAVKEKDPEAVVIGEVWEDASNKVSYGQRRRYLLGSQLDGVMNYPFRDAILDYVRNGNSDHFYMTVTQILENYPPPTIACLLNSLGTHDTIRAITMLGGEPDNGRDRAWQEQNHYLPPDRYELGCRLFGLASILQFGMPGMPCVYYGDEAGAYGYKDPFNRTCFPWGRENPGLMNLLRSLGRMREAYPILADAPFLPIVLSHDLLCFERRGDDVSIFFAVNRSQYEQHLVLPPRDDGKTLVLQGAFDGKTLIACSGVVIAYPRN